MEQSRLIFEASPWWILPGVLIALVYAYLLYGRSNAFSTTWRLTLAAFRATLAFLLYLILLNPLLRTVFTQSESANYLLIVDNSASIKEARNGADTAMIVQLVEQMKKLLSEKNVNLRVVTFKGELPESSKIAFNHPITNIDKLMQSAFQKVEGRPLAGALLVSDGIFNQGLNPAYRQLNHPLSTLGVGDTTPRRDARIAAVYHNKVSFVGNKFPIQAEVEATGMGGQSAELLLKRGEQVIDKQVLKFNSRGLPNKIDFTVEAKQKGVEKYTLELKTQSDELTLKNNQRTIYIEILEGKERILIVAPSPHPDIKALRAALEKEENFEVQLYIPGMHVLDKKPYSLLILYQVPDILMSNAYNDVEKWINAGTPVWYMIGSLSNISKFNQVNPLINIQQRGIFDNINGYANETFNLFNIDQELRKRYKELPPLAVPFGDVTQKAQIENVLYQAVGNTRTSKPLLLIGTQQDKKTAVFMGEGLWTWRMQEAKLYDDTRAFDNLVVKTVQYLSAKDDKRKFRCTPVKIEVLANEKLGFETETYNSIFERVYQKKITLNLVGDNGKKFKYEFINSEANNIFEIPGMPPGIYKYTATAELDGKVETITGQVYVKEADLELSMLTANHELLRTLAENNGGKFYNSTTQLLDELSNKTFPATLRSKEEYKDLINLRWLFIILLMLLTTEWVVRKVKGEV